MKHYKPKGGKSVPGLMSLNMKDRMAKLRSMKGKKQKPKRGGQFGEIMIPAAAIAIGSAGSALINAAMSGIFNRKPKPAPPPPPPPPPKPVPITPITPAPVPPQIIKPTQQYENSDFRGNGIIRPNLMRPYKRRGGMMATPTISGPLA